MEQLRNDVLTRLLEEVEELRAEVTALRSDRAAPLVPDATEHHVVSRRGLLKKVGGGAAAGVAGAVGASVLTPSLAAAAEGDPVLLGRYNEVVDRGTFIANNLGEY